MIATPESGLVRYSSIARAIGISREGVRKVEARALKKVRAALDSDCPMPPTYRAPSDDTLARRLVYHVSPNHAGASIGRVGVDPARDRTRAGVTYWVGARGISWARSLVRHSHCVYGVTVWVALREGVGWYYLPSGVWTCDRLVIAAESNREA